MHLFSRSVSFFLLLILTLSAHAGQRLQYDVHQPQIKERVSIYVQGELARLVSSANGQFALVYNQSTQQLHILDHAKQSVTTVDQATLSQLASIAQGVGELARGQGGVLGDLFETFGFDNELGDNATIKLKTLAAQKTFAGMTCQMHQVLKNDQLVTQLCMAETVNMSVNEQATLVSLLTFTQLLVQKGQLLLEQFSLPVPVLPQASLAGVPLYLEDTLSNISAKLIERREMSIPAAQFVVPAAYTQTLFGF